MFGKPRRGGCAPPSLARRGVRRALAALVLLAGWPGAGTAMRDETVRLTLASAVAQGESRRCGTCHGPEYSLWASHAHSGCLVDPVKEPRRIRARWGRDVPGWKANVDRKFARSDVGLAFGGIQVQVYFRRRSSGFTLLPAQWNLSAGRWEALTPDLQRVVREGITWEAGCAGCHTTGFRVEDATYTEKGVGCAACHGAAEEHAASGGRKRAGSLAALSPVARSSLCGRCHSRGRDRKTGRPYAVGFLPGATLADVVELQAPAAEAATEYFWRDGTERLPFMEYQGFVQSGHFREGMACTTCHLAHGSDFPYNLRFKTVGLCEGCHPSVETPVHRGHPTAKASCVDCHMPQSSENGRPHVHTHTFRFLPPEGTLRDGTPNSCTVTCHGKRDPAWAERAVKAWRAK